MARIRKLNCFDLPKIKKMISYLGNIDETQFSKALKNIIMQKVQNFLPLRFSFLPESFVLVDENDEILGLITVVPVSGNPYKIAITRLAFSQNMYGAGKQLVEFVLAKFGAKGAQSFCVNVDQSHDELLNLFLNGCGFRQCSYENLWKIEDFHPETSKKARFRYCQNSDAKSAADLYNNELNTLYRPSMERTFQEYKEPIFKGFTNFYKNRYVLEDFSTHRLIAYISVTTADNLNFIIDISKNDAYEIPYDEILNFALDEISKRKTKFYAFIKHRQYTKNADVFEEYLHRRNLNCIQTKCILVKDYYKFIKQNSALQMFSFGEKMLTSD